MRGVLLAWYCSAYKYVLYFKEPSSNNYLYYMSLVVDHLHVKQDQLYFFCSSTQVNHVASSCNEAILTTGCSSNKSAMLLVEQPSKLGISADFPSASSSTGFQPAFKAPTTSLAYSSPTYTFCQLSSSIAVGVLPFRAVITWLNMSSAALKIRLSGFSIPTS